MTWRKALADSWPSVLIAAGFLIGYETAEWNRPESPIDMRWHEAQIEVRPDGTVETRDCVIDVAPLDESLGADIRPFWLNFWSAHRSPPAPPPAKPFDRSWSAEPRTQAAGRSAL